VAGPVSVKNQKFSGNSIYVQTRIASGEIFEIRKSHIFQTLKIILHPFHSR